MAVITQKYFKLIEVQCNVLFLSAFGVELAVKIEGKKSLEYGRMHTWASKTQKLPGPLSRSWTKNGTLCSGESTLLPGQLSASEAGPP